MFGGGSWRAKCEGFISTSVSTAGEQGGGAMREGEIKAEGRGRGRERGRRQRRGKKEKKAERAGIVQGKRRLQGNLTVAFQC